MVTEWNRAQKLWSQQLCLTLCRNTFQSLKNLTLIGTCQHELKTNRSLSMHRLVWGHIVVWVVVLLAPRLH